jgi:sterol desaturase/sphingolipid hydroxylase (fatty acid hydroxylase superfamily)
LLETASPLRRRVERRALRWTHNAALGALSAIVVRSCVLTAVFATARRGRRARGAGLLARVPAPLQVPVGLALLDASMYAWHRLNHQVPLLWRFHRVHHVDTDLDVSTALRFHPGEQFLSIPFRALQTLMIGPSPELAVGYELALQTATAFHHANVRLPVRVDRGLRALLVTPRMHQIHHSIVPAETDSNWSVIFSIWDRLAATLRSDNDERHLTIGLPGRAVAAEPALRHLLRMPFDAPTATQSGPAANGRSACW